MSYFRLHEEINTILYHIFNFVSDSIFLMNRGLRLKIKDNRKYRDCHAGERCFIIATGPSIKNLTLEQVSCLSKECVFAVNSMYKAPILRGIIPRYYALFDNNYWGEASNEFSEIRHLYKDTPPTFITDFRAKRFIPEDTKYVALYAKNYPIKDMRYDLSGNVSIAMNVVGFAIISAIYMGFKEIYLLGSDYSLFCSRTDNHCYDDYLDNQDLPRYNLSFYLKYYHLTTEIHYLIAKLARDNNIQIVNLTDGSLLDAYPIKSLSDVLRIDPDKAG